MKPSPSLRRSLARLLGTALVAVLGAVGSQAADAADVGVSISVSQPGVYGRVDIGRFPQPALVAVSPVLVAPRVVAEPVYLWVPPGHRRHWSRHCGQYGACGAPVYFVQDGWSRRHVMPAAVEPAWRDGGGRPDYRPERGHGHGHHGHGRGHRD